MNKILQYIKSPEKILMFFSNRKIIFLSDKKYLRIIYYLIFKRKLDLDNPITYNEKLQWLKINDHNDKYTNMVDKYEAKKIVSRIIGEKYIIPTLGIYEKFDDINFNELPSKFVIKCTHDSGGIVICKNIKSFNIKKAKKIINKSLRRNYYYGGREWPYKNIKPRILIEKYMEDNKTKELRDYKFFCFNGCPKMMFLATDRQIGKTKFNFYDLKFNLLPFIQGHPNDLRKIDKPCKFDEMIKLSKQLSKGIPHVRVDFYEINGNIYFGELTFYHYSGFTKFEPEEWDKKIGDLLDISVVKKNEK